MLYDGFYLTIDEDFETKYFFFFFFYLKFSFGPKFAKLKALFIDQMNYNKICLYNRKLMQLN